MREVLRGAVRLPQGSPIFALSTVAILALSVGAATPVFTLTDPMLIRPLPYPGSERRASYCVRWNPVPWES